jgi:hypothetical protein
MDGKTQPPWPAPSATATTGGRRTRRPRTARPCCVVNGQTGQVGGEAPRSRGRVAVVVAAVLVVIVVLVVLVQVFG